MVVLLPSFQNNKLERFFLFLEPLEKIRPFSRKKSFKPKTYLALSTRFSDIHMLLSQPSSVKMLISFIAVHSKSRKENPQKLTQLSSRSHPRHLVGKRTARKDTIIDITSDSQVNSIFPNRWSPASLTLNNYFYLFLYLYIT